MACSSDVIGGLGYGGVDSEIHHLAGEGVDSWDVDEGVSRGWIITLLGFGLRFYGEKVTCDWNWSSLVWSGHGMGMGWNGMG